MMYALQDSIAARSPLPDPLIPVVQWIFQRPGWVMIGGIVLAAVVVPIVLLLLWKRRAPILEWFATRDRGVKIALAAAFGVVLLAAVGTGTYGYHYMEHDNDFCLGCHVMIPRGQPFIRPDTGTYLIVNRIDKESPHDSLECHACHESNWRVQLRELWLWMAERPERVPPHAKVQDRVCEKCHEMGEAKEMWQQIKLTAGHRTHLESDSASLRGVQCVTCHGLEAHRYVPVDSTCYQQGCHLQESVGIQLGKMASQTSLHCNLCHRFTAAVPRLATRDSASGTLRPGSEQCFLCHQMRALVAEFDIAGDPHGGTCGMCHNPHEQTTAAAARATCTTARCHADWRKEPFHLGLRHREVARQCTTCHRPHQARVDASDCVGCHQAVRSRERGGRLHLPLPFDTTRALQRTSSADPGPPPRGKGDTRPARGSPAWPIRTIPVATRDTFSHQRHQALPCLTCHATRSGHGKLTFEPRRGCQICHHQAPATSRCSTCHAPSEIENPHPVTIRVAVAGRSPRTRTVGFSHPAHAETGCTECHATPVSLDPSAAAHGCTSCHDQHHQAGEDCAVCHRSEPTIAAHRRPAEAHAECDTCHPSATVVRLTPDRPFCLTCHSPAQDHYAARECTACHFQTSPAGYRSVLRRARGSP